ncbi:MAG: gliding motility-associated protein GldE [Bacteroidetes bacterium]|nr:gliding motility-associated protein GldE [Bacteroidota bacterium]MBL6943156.1 gliding motility-associated protein GldE [Bacteroidales bacterium]
MLIIISENFFLGFTTDIVIALLVIIILLLFSGLISGSETAFFSLSPSNIDALKVRNGKKDKAILQLLTKPKQLLATILISNNFINVSIVILSTYITVNLFDLQSNKILIFFIQVVVVTSVLLIFGEIIPKILSNKEPVSVATLMVLRMTFLIWFFKPLSSILVSSTSFIDKRMGKKGHNISMSDLSDAIEITSDTSVTDDEKFILKGIATFGEKEASEIMVSRVNVTAIDCKLSFNEVIDVVLKSGFSRIPVYDETLDKISGILYIKDLLSCSGDNEDTGWQKLIRKPVFFVPENKKINDLLQEFRDKKIHVAIVVDEYGGTSGIITLEDIIEEIVGEISDEFDMEPHQFKYEKISDNTYIFEAKTPIVDFCKILNLNDEIFDDVRGESDSLGGLILEFESKIPESGSVVSFKQFRFEITDADQRKINEVKVIIND